jgi:hypothetical protein
MDAITARPERIFQTSCSSGSWENNKEPFDFIVRKLGMLRARRAWIIIHSRLRDRPDPDRDWETQRGHLFFDELICKSSEKNTHAGVALYSAEESECAAKTILNHFTSSNCYKFQEKPLWFYRGRSYYYTMCIPPTQIISRVSKIYYNLPFSTETLF